MLRSKELREERMKLVTDARQILEKKELTAEDRAKYDALMADVDAKAADIARFEKLEAEDRAAATPVLTPEQQDQAASYRSAFYQYLLDPETLSPEQRAILKKGYVEEKRTAQSTTTTAGGYLIPQGFMAELAKATLAYVDVEKAARVITTDTGNDIPWPTLDDTAVKGRLLAESGAITNTAFALGQKILKAYKWSSDSILVPSELLQDSAFNTDSLLAELLGERIGRIKADYYTTGTGTSQPEGVVAGAGAGVTAASATALTSDEIIDLYHSVDPSYRNSPKCAFMLNDAIVKYVRKLKNGTTGDYMWQPGLQAGAPDTLLNKPVIVNQSMDSAMTAGKKVMLFGDFNKYVVRNVNGVYVRRLNELYAANDQVGFIAFARSDARYVYGGSANAAVKLLVLAAS